ncbi:5-hydroxytryptamine receptor 3A-like [Xyrauchen texanus]|uniref:5-hydroxytryptamine receptor 3A-like n=1 Tax=Xyrauchen texanus TaxID=154827 RepID=UPI002242A38C|nr:5-hydroxytryptamine receptor 3A-like [Xyrauchen texanus]
MSASNESKMVLKSKISLFLLIFSSMIGLVVMTSGNQTISCNSRCLANSIIAKKLKNAPQGDNCDVSVTITSIQYEMLSFDTKDMQMNNLIKLNLRWRDPELGWNKTINNISAILLPVDKIWTPGIVFENAIYETEKPYTSDVKVTQNGNVDHAIIVSLGVSCDISLFYYPFVVGECSVGINGWNQSGCGLTLKLPGKDNLSLIGGSEGEWMVVSVQVTNDILFENRTYLSVKLSINPFSATMTLILPSVLIMLADLVSFALPVYGGERNNLKVTLVLSLTMFLLILNDRLPSGGRCSPLLHYHFCFCLVSLVLSMVASIVLTRLALEDNIMFCRHSKSTKKKHCRMDQVEEIDAIATTKSDDLASETASLQKIVNFLENIDYKEEVTDSNEDFAERMDKICFWFFFLMYIIYFISLCIITRTEICKAQKTIPWDNDNSFDHGYWYFYNDTETYYYFY